MTDQHSPSSATQPATAPASTVAQACVHIDAAAQQLEATAQQLEATANSDVFSPLLVLAGQLALVRGGIDPTIRAALDPNDPHGPIAHVERALTMLDSVPPLAGPPDLLVWTQRLADLRDALLATEPGQA